HGETPDRAWPSILFLRLLPASSAAFGRDGVVAQDSFATISSPAIRLGLIFPRDPDFAAKAGRILDLYDRVWQGRALSAREFVISADEKSSIQARRRQQPTLSPT